MSRFVSVVVVLLLVASALCFALVPVVVPDSSDVVRDTVTLAGAQGVPGAWLARTGFVLLGAAVLAEAARDGDAWGPAGRAAHAVFGAATVSMAVFSASPGRGGASDAVEASLHTWAATVAVAAFVVGVLAVRIRRGTRPGPVGVLDVAALAAAVVLALAAETMPAGAGVTERLLLTVGLVWYTVEAVRQTRIGAAEPS
ncbi:DUF998 domain-containing protein [Isoptericola aurantiacus]|uniref:DUF998 domain-containing protein n=1 Tax=Isoptericola aurantiacus TaxID=3377839 RepID=UPI00383BA656